MEGGLLDDVIVGDRAVVLELLSSKDEALLVGWRPLLAADLCLDRPNKVQRLNVKRDGGPVQCPVLLPVSICKEK